MYVYIFDRYSTMTCKNVFVNIKYWSQYNNCYVASKALLTDNEHIPY